MLKNKSSKPKEFADRDLHTILLFPAMSWSSMNSFMNYDKEEWYQQYALGIRRKFVNGAMQIGINVGERLVSDKKFLPKVPRPKIYEHEARAVLNGISLVGHMDGFTPSIPRLDEYKTTSNFKKWDKKSVKDHGQLKFYTLLLWLTEGIRPESLKIFLTSIPVRTKLFTYEVDESKEIRTIETSYTMSEIMKFASDIKNVHRQMKDFINNKKMP